MYVITKHLPSHITRFLFVTMVFTVSIVIMAPQTSHTATVISFIDTYGGTEARNISVWVGGATQAQTITSYDILYPTNCMEHPWLGKIFKQKEINPSPQRGFKKLSIEPMGDYGSVYDRDKNLNYIVRNHPWRTFVPISQNEIGITCIFTWTYQNDDTSFGMVALVITSLKTLSALDITYIGHLVKPNDVTYNYSQPCIIPSSTTEAITLLATPDLNLDGSITSKDLLIFQDAWHGKQ